MHMPNRNEIIYRIIEAAVDKGIKDITDNPNRGLRRLLDLGNHFAKKGFQKSFFRIASQVLNDESSPYYKLADNIVRNVDPHIIKRFGINLGYNCWTYGAKKIREHEKINGYNIPWTIVFYLQDETENGLSVSQISDILNTAESIGTFCGMFFLNEDIEKLRSIIKMLGEHRRSCYILFLKPEIISDEIANLISGSYNIIVAFDTNDIENNQLCKNGARILLDNKCLYGAYCTCNDSNLNYYISDSYLETLEDLKCSFAFYINKSLYEMKNKLMFSKFMSDSKYRGSYSLFLIDFYEDLSFIDRVISTDKCFIAIKNDGSIMTLKDGTSAKGLNIKTHSLKTILKKTMPRPQYI
ncbi:MAG TPA: hypothetical protein GX498_04385 [Clostridiales bacterium]|nr:hypothetical protein [Clostridiales bacterium]